MEQNLSLLAFTAVSIGFIHTVAGPDHYLPFVAMSKARNWSMIKTINVTVLCGLGHVLSSVVLGFIGIAAGLTVSKLEWFEGVRGSLASWLLFIAGLIYTIWALYRRFTHKDHHHHHGKDKLGGSMTFWVLFTIFVLGPCEPLIPILMYPAALHNTAAVVIISLLFSLVTIATMVAIVVLMLKGISVVKLHTLEKYQHIAAGVILTLSGAAIIFLGL